MSQRMRALLLVGCLVFVVGCKKDAPPPPPPPAEAPHEVTVEGVFHAVKCGGVTALWSGADGNMPAGAPKSFGAESLAFRFSDGVTEGFKPTGQLFFSDWTFDIFSPDCEFAVLQGDHFGPLHVVATSQLRQYLRGELKPTVVEAPKGADAAVYSQVRWNSGAQFEFVASCCGGAQAFRVNAKDGAVTKLFEAKEAPKGVRRGATGWEATP